jgi:hypothetical protein
MHLHEMQQLNVYLIYEFIEFYSFRKIGCYWTIESGGTLIKLGFPIFRKVQITIDLGGFETHRSGFKSKEMNPATLAPRILWLST